MRTLKIIEHILLDGVIQHSGDDLTVAVRRLKSQDGPPLIPNWSRVEAACPDFFADLRDAVGKDNA